MVVGNADRNLIVFNLQNPQVGSIEGRVGVRHLDDLPQGKNFTFKCHREANKTYSVNSLNFHPVNFCTIIWYHGYILSYSDLPLFQLHHNFATAGSDEAFNFWDEDRKQRLKEVCYDWSKGAENHNPAMAKTYIFFHLPQDSEVKSKASNWE
ncbi:hypothetical protein PTKIN_Ptkin10aG0099000 [Pterospermum kingtungense]